MRIFIFLTIMTGIAYPLLVTGIAQLGFGRLANGSLIERDGKIVGSELIAQKFEKPGVFWARPSAIDYNPMPSGGSNLGPTSQDLKSKIEERKKLGASDDLLFTSGSGLDPHVSLVSAKNQIPRIVKAYKTDVTRLVTELIEELAEKRQFGVFGDPHVNVLRLNLALRERLKQSGIQPAP